MKRILYVSPFSRLGGGEISLLAILNNLDRKRFEPHVIFYEEGQAADKLRNVASVSVIRRGSYVTDPALIIRLARYIREHDIDLVHVNSLDMRAGIAARLAGSPLVGHLRVIFPFTWRDRLFVRLADKVIAVSNEVVRSICRGSPELKDRFTVIYNCVDAPELTVPADLRRKYGLPDKARVVGAAGRMDPWKGYEFLIAAAVKVVRERPETYFILAGKPSDGDPAEQSYMRSLRARASSCGIGDHFIFAGFTEDPLGFISGCDVVVVPSYELKVSGSVVKTEGFGRVAIESMAAGVPVIASDIGAFREIISPGRTGLLVKPADGGAISEAIMRVLDDGALRSHLAEEGRKSYETSFTARRQLDAIETLYESVIEGGKI